ncbi:hypothetical protein D3C81_2074770 [compost metagenome]
MIASGRYPSSTRSWKLTEPWRLDSLDTEPSSFRPIMSGRCTKIGVSQPNMLYSCTYRGVEVTYSEPRTTWVISIRWSSTTLARLYVG